MHDGAFTAAFPVLEETAYFNAGTCGPTPQASTDAIVAELQRLTAHGRTLATGASGSDRPVSEAHPHDTLAEGRPGSKHPISERRR